MDQQALEQALSVKLPSQLAHDLVENFIQIRRDVAFKTLGRTAPGKFVETLVQILQYLETGNFQSAPKVDSYLKKLENQPSSLNNDLRLCVSRVARAMYTLRNKRNIAHKGMVDPNQYDLEFLLHSAQWILAELLRQVSGLSMQEAGRFVTSIYVPVDDIVEDFETRRLVLPIEQNLTTKEELLVLLHSVYPEAKSKMWILESMDRRHPKTVGNNLRELWKEKLVEELEDDQYVLTKQGYSSAKELVDGIRTA